MLNPTRVLATLSFTITAYMALLLAPEPVTKGVAAAFSLLMWGYLGWEFFDLLRAYARLHEDAPRASTFAELREVGEHFGKVIGPSSVRVLVMVATAAIGETAALLSKGPRLPGLGQASGTVELNTGLRLMDAATGVERVIVSVNEGTIRVVSASQRRFHDRAEQGQRTPRPRVRGWLEKRQASLWRASSLFVLVGRRKHYQIHDSDDSSVARHSIVRVAACVWFVGH